MSYNQISGIVSRQISSNQQRSFQSNPSFDGPSPEYNYIRGTVELKLLEALEDKKTDYIESAEFEALFYCLINAMKNSNQLCAKFCNYMLDIRSDSPIFEYSRDYLDYSAEIYKDESGQMHYEFRNGLCKTFFKPNGTSYMISSVPEVSNIDGDYNYEVVLSCDECNVLPYIADPSSAIVYGKNVSVIKNVNENDKVTGAQPFFKPDTVEEYYDFLGNSTVQSSGYDFTYWSALDMKKNNVLIKSYQVMDEIIKKYVFSKSTKTR